MKLWVALEDLIEDEDSEWGSDAGLVGVFDTREAAIAACYNDCCFVSSAILNEDLGAAKTPFEDSYYPLAPEKGVVDA
jgi:hypothetical protein